MNKTEHNPSHTETESFTECAQTSSQNNNPASHMEEHKDPTTDHTLPPQIAPKAPPSPNATRELRAPRSYALNSLEVKPNLSAFSPPPPLNIKSLKSLIIEQPGFSDSIQLPSVPRLGKPGPHDWFRVKGKESEWPCYYVYKPKGEMGDNNYLVTPELAGMLGSLAIQKRLVTCITLEGDIFFWPLTVSERPNGYNDSGRIIAGEAITEWRRMVADVKVGIYRPWIPRFPKPDPVWPNDEELDALFVRACEGRIIDSMNHPAIIKLF